jgi:PhzF family phenazine biosynthesis protein
LLDNAGDESWMQAVAAEMNLAETAFVYPIEDGFSLRWFSPTTEVDLCGHATLASAHILWEAARLPADRPARFHTKSGVLTCVKRSDGIEMDFPATIANPEPAPRGLLESLGVAPGATVARSRFDYFVELESEQKVRALAPDFRALKELDVRGVIVTAPGTGRFDFVSRFFAPRVGIDEDPVTGSAHCALAPWWATKLGNNRMTAFQASRRGGVVGVEVRGDRVLLHGQAITVARGEILH